MRLLGAVACLLGFHHVEHGRGCERIDAWLNGYAGPARCSCPCAPLWRIGIALEERSRRRG